MHKAQDSRKEGDEAELDYLDVNEWVDEIEIFEEAAIIGVLDEWTNIEKQLKESTCKN